MTLPVMQFPLLSFDQANPGLMAASNITQTLGQILQNQQQGIKNKYLPQSLQEALTAAHYKNQLLGPQAEQGQERASAELSNMQAIAPHMNAETKEILQGNIPELQAHAGQLGAETKYMPLKYAIEAANSMRQNSRFGDAFQFSKVIQTLPAGQREAYISEHPDEYQNMLDTLGNKALQSQQNQGNDLLSNVVNKYFPGMPTKTNQGPVVGNVNGVSLTADQMKTLQQVQQEQKQGSQFTSSSQQIENTGDAFKLAADNKLVAPQQRRRADAAVTLEKWLSDNRASYAPMINNATKFAGILGKTKSLEDAISQSSPQEYTDYKTFKTSFVPNLANQMRMQEGMGATDQQSKVLDQMYQAGLNIDQSPEGAKKMINDSIKMTQDIGDSVFQGSEPLHKGIHRKMYNLPKLDGNYTDIKSNISKDEWMSMAKSHANNKGVSDQELSDYYDKKYGGKK
jgi:hypothetical protein